jgi:hypothetical protein
VNDVRRKSRRFLPFVVLALLIGTIALPAVGVGPRDQVAARRSKFLRHLSQSVSIRFASEQPGRATGDLGRRLQQVSREAEGASQQEIAGRGAGPLGDRFNRDGTGLPQNEESISACRSRPNVVLGATNDFRGLLLPEEDEPFTGWHLSTNGGDSVRSCLR